MSAPVNSHSGAAAPASSEKKVFQPTLKYKTPLIARNEYLKGEDYISCYRTYGKAAERVINEVYEILRKKDKEGKNYLEPVRLLAKASGVSPDDFLKGVSESLYNFKTMRYEAEDLKKLKSLLKQTTKIAGKFNETDQKRFETAFGEFYRLRHSRPALYIGKLLSMAETLKKFDAAVDAFKDYQPVKNHPKLSKKANLLWKAASEYSVSLAALKAYCGANQITPDGVRKRLKDIPRSYGSFMTVVEDLIKDEDVAKSPQMQDLLVNVIRMSEKISKRHLEIDIKEALIAELAMRRDESSHTHTPQDIAPASGISLYAPDGVKEDKLYKALMAGEAQNRASQTANPYISAADLRAATSPAVGREPGTDDFVNFIKKYGKPENFIAPGKSTEVFNRPAPIDDKNLREVQRLTDWADTADNMKHKVQTVEELGKILEEIALTPAGKPDPEYTALMKRLKKLKLMQRQASTVREINKATNELEKTGLDTQYNHLNGLSEVMSGKLKNKIEEANITAKLNNMSIKAAKSLAAKVLESELMIKQFSERYFQTMMKIMTERDNNTWQRIKQISFKY